MRKVLGIIISVFAVFFSVPTGLILASWNALPGDSLYTTKRALENVTLTIVQSTPLASSFSVGFTDRRYKEADKLLATKGSTLGYSLLVEQAQQTKNIIVDQKNTQQADQLIQNIDQYEKLIEAKKSIVAAEAQQATSIVTNTQPSQTGTQPQPVYTSPSQTGTVTQPQTTQTQTTQPAGATTPTQTQPQAQQPSQAQPAVQQPVQQPSVNPQQNAQQTIAQLNDAQQHLERIKNEIKKELPDSASERAKDVNENNNPQGKGRD